MANMTWIRRPLAVFAALALILAACGSDDGTTDASTTDSDRPTVVVTTNILGDVVTELVGDQATVVTIMSIGADPHSFQPSAQEVEQVLAADALIVNGSGFEEGLLSVIDTAGEEGVATYEAIEAVDTIDFSSGGHDDDHHGDEADHDDEHGEEADHDEDADHDEEDHDDEADHDEDHDDEADHDDEDHDEHGHDGADPHFFTDPVRMAEAVEAIGAFLAAEVEGIDVAALDEAVDGYLTELDTLHADVESLVAAIPEDRRVLITNHEVFGYFADRYGFEVVGTVIPGGSTVDSASAGELAELVEVIEAEGVPAIFTDAASSSSLAETLAAEVGEVAIVDLFTESLGDAESEGATYLDMVRTNAARISAALA